MRPEYCSWHTGSRLRVFMRKCSNFVSLDLEFTAVCFFLFYTLTINNDMKIE